ncbi:MAG: dipeptidase [Candidatus Dormibacter sp.]|uniref:dipeptidase n=1 Tax=Candidatus Dormibacter sp. TaxID=2973982 RepID=UPI000DB36052|nr:MAG: dipeptidase [Candidatus Dormibacteraeota bacterium]
MLENALQLARASHRQAETELFQLLSIPSISTLPEHRLDCRRAADWLVAKLRGMGMEAELVDVREPGHPVVVAEWLGRPGAPTLAIYGHYDVQPADPLEEWLTPPFEPTLKDGFVYARGADDNKGQHLAGVKAAEYWFQAGGPPLNLRFLIEGEEEASGRSLPDFLRANAARLRSDYLLLADGGFTAPGQPNLLTGLRGLLYTEIEVRGPAVDLHSGIFGGAAPNPFNSLAHVLAALKDREGRILIPGFYDDVEPPSAQELADWAKDPVEDAELMRRMGSTALPGEPGYSARERIRCRPTLDVHGVIGGFTGIGSKTVIPATAKAKVSMRLVPNQDPARIAAALGEFVPSLATVGTTARLIELSSASPVRVDVSHPGIAAASRAFQAAFGAAPLLTREGGSVPVTLDFQEALRTQLIVTGFGLPDDALHSPNERYSLDQYHRGTEMVMHLMQELAAR